ncbi:MAG TPA: matrixin family metalloprotease [Candidatus Nanoarchaeia archaeon]|nr:matrixin family metalloprotease [Candidatus Nanoarchaeia archaeon]
MVKFNLLVLLFISVLAVGFAAASMLIPANDDAKENAKAPENSPVINENWGLERVDFIHYAKPNGVGSTKSPSCYKLMGVKWNPLPVSYVINPSNSQGLSEGFVTSTISASAETWDSATSSEVFSNTYAVNYSAQYGVQNFQNALVFGDYPDSGVIGVTSVWYTRVGKRIVEFDMLLNTDFVWGDATLNSSAMDLQNIITHELGHSIGLDDIYSTSCLSVTMYGYSTEGETSKRILETADIAGLQKMYGV